MVAVVVQEQQHILVHVLTDQVEEVIPPSFCLEHLGVGPGVRLHEVRSGRTSVPKARVLFCFPPHTTW